MEIKAHPKRPYLQVFLSLAVLTGIEVIVSGLALEHSLRLAILLGLAAFKAAMVAMFFMHLRYDHRLLAVIAGVPFLFGILLLLVLLMDKMMMMQMPPK